MRQKFPLFIQHLILCLVVVMIYSPAFRAEPCLLDDVAALEGLQGSARLDLKGILFPDSAQFTYYRPMIGVSYWLAQTFWHAAPQAMHIENIVFHLFNVVLLFWLIRVSLPQSPDSNRYVPFFGALLFAVHPIATESVNWISGRTDLIAGCWLLGATIAIMQWQRNRTGWWLLLSALLLTAGAIMTKETAWGFLLMLPLLLAAPYDSTANTLRGLAESFSRLEKLCLAAVLALCFLLATLLVSFWPPVAFSVVLGLTVLYRKPRQQPLPKKVILLITGLLITAAVLAPSFIKQAQQSAADNFYSTFSRTLLTITLDVDSSITLFSAALAFYIKKFFLPLPLSFAITDIAPGYLFAGIAVIIITAFLCAWRSRAALLALTGLALLLPALPLAHGEIAWAPYAERYLYIPSAFWIASLAAGFSSLSRPPLRTVCAVLCLALITAAAVITFKRSQVWQTNVTLFEDTVRKSPNHTKARILYMTVLGQAGRLTEALQQYRYIQTHHGNGMRLKYANDLAQLLYAGGMKREAFEVLDTVMTNRRSGGEQRRISDHEVIRLEQFHQKLHRELFP